MPPISKYLGLETFISPWLDQLILIAFATLALHLIAKLFFAQGEKLANKTSSLWDDAVINAVKAPLVALIWLLGMVFILLQVDAHYDFGLTASLHIAKKNRRGDLFWLVFNPCHSSLCRQLERDASR